MLIWQAINIWAEKAPEKTALRHIGGRSLSYSDLRDAVIYTAEKLGCLDKGERVGLLVSNSPLWSVYDLALTLKGCTVVPIPEFFSPSQIDHMLRDCDVRNVIAEIDLIPLLRENVNILEAVATFKVNAESPTNHNFPSLDKEHIVKITYTSGTTGAPKGVMLKFGGIEALLQSLKNVLDISAAERQLSLMPLSVLLENISGLYLPLLCGAEVVYHPAAHLRCDGETLYRLMHEIKPTTLLIVPGILEILLDAWRPGWNVPSSLKYIACGGAVVSSACLQEAHTLGLPVYEGYGLSELTSVSAVNSVEKNRPGSVGIPLSHLKLSIADDTEILISGSSLMSGYVGSDPLHNNAVWHTGDTGYIDNEGFLYITGRKKDIFITSSGRNISPEWIEASIRRSPLVRQVFVIGEARPYVSALIFAADPVTDRGLFRQSIEDFQEDIPEYAQVREFCLINRPFSVDDGTITSSGRLRRAIIIEIYREEIELLYEEKGNKNGYIFTETK